MMDGITEDHGQHEQTGRPGLPLPARPRRRGARGDEEPGLLRGQLRGWQLPTGGVHEGLPWGHGAMVGQIALVEK